MRGWLVLIAMLVVSPPIGAAPQPDTGLSADWELISDRDGIQVYMRHTDTSRLKTFRGVTRMTLPDENALVAALDDYENVPRWLQFVDGAEELDRDSPISRYVRFTTELPWPLTDREAIVQTRVLQNVTPEAEYVELEVRNLKGMIPENPAYVRFPEIAGMFKIQRLGNWEVELTYELVMDPGGNVPVWLANLLLRDAPFFTLQKLRRFLVFDEYQNRHFDWVEVFGPGRPKDLPPPRSYLYGNPPETPLVDMTLEMMNPRP